MTKEDPAIETPTPGDGKLACEILTPASAAVFAGLPLDVTLTSTESAGEGSSNAPYVIRSIFPNVQSWSECTRASGGTEKPLSEIGNASIIIAEMSDDLTAKRYINDYMQNRARSSSATQIPNGEDGFSYSGDIPTTSSRTCIVGARFKKTDILLVSQTGKPCAHAAMSGFLGIVGKRFL
ncbi:hypothetical protein [Planobispora takensis]|uniref:hypothetical protein n=1 Tax=Planobispora takensis TaxID=1367882 RepID=UPI001940CDC5|nr:hypothetical protein [Planobispora takensis]